MSWIVRRIMEDDYGCEERTKEDLDRDIVLLENEKGETVRLTSQDSMLRRMEIDEGSEWPKALFHVSDSKTGL